MLEKKAFLAKGKHQYHVSQYGEHGCSAQSQKKQRLLWESKLVSFHRWTLTIRKMVKIKAFPANPKLQCCVSQWGEHNCSAHNRKNKDYYEYPSLFHFTDEI